LEQLQKSIAAVSEDRKIKADLEKSKAQHLEQEAEKLVLHKKLDELQKQEKEMEEQVRKEKESLAKEQSEKAQLVQQETSKIFDLAEIAEKANKTAQMQLTQVKSSMAQELKMEQETSKLAQKKLSLEVSKLTTEKKEMANKIHQTQVEGEKKLLAQS